MIVTKEELDILICPDWRECKKVYNEVLSRPDPLALLEAWRKWRMYDMDTNFQEDWDEEDDFIKLLRTNSSAVREQGIREGWWVE